MKKTLLITLDFFPRVGGVAEYYRQLCEGIEKEEKGKIVVLTGKVKENEGKFDFKVYRENLLWKKIAWPRWSRMFYGVTKILKTEKIEMLWAGEILPTGSVIYILSKLFRVPYIVSCHGTDILQAARHKRKKKMAIKILQRAEKIVVNSKYTEKLLKEMGITPGKIEIIYPGVERASSDTLKLPAKFGLESGQYILSVGRLVERKGHDRVIRAMEEVWQECPDLVYVIVGDGPERKRLEEAAADEKVKFLGSVVGEEKKSLYANCDFFVMPGRQAKGDVEGFGIVYLEAASFGKAVVGGRSGGAGEAVADGETGLLVDGNSTAAIARAIVQLRQNKELKEKLGKRGEERAAREFSWERSVRKLINIL